MTTILLVEDDPIIRQTVEYALRRAGFNTVSSANGLQALEVAATSKPDLILLDLMLPGADGYVFAQSFREINKHTPIIIVTALDQESDKIKGLDAGADDYITKPFSMQELLARVRANLRRTREQDVLSNEPIAIGDLSIEPNQLKASVAGVPVKLRLKEFQLLVTLASHPGVLRTRQFLASEVWGYEALPTSRTIDVHIRRLRQGIEDPSRFTYIHTVHGMGYRFEPIPKDE
ncbi:MAG: response regulator transcription factor [Actinobacteria bacterium]|nr:response regulator transcription factor [Actinomycetota bacterium]MCL5887113.1 response regulator transcription factor [Actinomycetota bacterium]